MIKKQDFNLDGDTQDDSVKSSDKSTQEQGSSTNDGVDCFPLDLDNDNNTKTTDVSAVGDAKPDQASAPSDEHNIQDDPSIPSTSDTSTESSVKGSVDDSRGESKGKEEESGKEEGGESKPKEDSSDDEKPKVVDAFGESLEKYISNLKDIIDNDKPRGVMSGLQGFDRIIGGFNPCRLSIIAAQTGVGKTALMMHIAKNAVMKSKNIIFFSLEMSNSDLMNRLLINICEIDSSVLVHGSSGLAGSHEQNGLKDQLKNRLYEFQTSHNLGKFFICDKRDITSDEIRVICNEIGDLDMVFVDYIQLVSKPENFTGQRYQAVGDNSRDLHKLSHELNAAVVAGAQLSRPTKDDKGKRPDLNKLRESGNLEQDADQVMILTRDKDENDQWPEPSNCHLYVDKNRHGATGYCKLTYIGKHFKFEDQE